MSPNPLQPLSAAVIKILRPLVRILLKYGVPYGTFAELAKWVYVDVGMKEFNIKGRKQSTSRVSTITGLSRKEVTRINQIKKPDDQESNEKYNRAARVIAAWRRNKSYLDSKNNPAALPIKGTGPTFSSMVKRFSGDVPARAILDELLRIKAVKQLEDGRVALLSKAYIPESGEPEKIFILGTDVKFLISTISHNLEADSAETRFQRKVFYDNLPDEALPAFRKLSAKQAQSLLENLDHWLSGQDRDVKPDVEGTGRNVAGIGIYYFEEPYSQEED